MSEEKIYPSVVIRSQAEAIELLEKENRQLKVDLQEANDTLDTHNELIRHQKQALDEIREYIKENTWWFDEELGLVEMKGYNTNRTPVVYTCYLQNILDKVKSNDSKRNV